MQKIFFSYLKVISWLFILFFLTFSVSAVESSNIQIENVKLTVEIEGSLSQSVDVSKYTFLGGSFEKIRVVPGEFVNQRYLAIIDRELNDLSMWRPKLDGRVYDIKAQNNLVFVSGDFKNIDDKPQPYLAVFDVDGMRLSKNQFQVNQPIRSIAFNNNEIILQPASNANEKITFSTEKAFSLESATDQDLRIDLDELGFQPPTLGEILTFAIRIFFVIAGLTALFYMLLGAFAWVTSSGDEEAVTAARNKIQAAVVGLILIVAVLAIIWTLEQAIFQRKICLGLSCPLTIPALLKDPEAE